MSFLRCLLRRFTFLPPVSATALVVCAPAVASTTVACTCTLVDVMLDVDDVCTLTSRLVAAHLMASLEALTAVAVARLPTFGVNTLFGTGEDRVRVFACVIRLRLLPSAASSTHDRPKSVRMHNTSAFAAISSVFNFNLHNHATLR